MVRPQRCPAFRSDRPWRGPQSRSLSSSITCVRLAIPAVRQKRSKLSPTVCQAASTILVASLALVVIVFFMALLSFSWIRHPEPNSSRRATPLLLFQQPSGHSHVKWLQERHQWPGLNAVVVVESRREINGTITDETRFYITSLAMPATAVGPMIRAHWAIENSLHWVMDMVFRDDECRVRTDNAPANFATCRHIAYNLTRM